MAEKDMTPLDSDQRKMRNELTRIISECAFQIRELDEGEPVHVESIARLAVELCGPAAILNQQIEAANPPSTMSER